MFDADNCYPRLSRPTSFHSTPHDVFVQMWTRLPIPGTCRSLVRKDMLGAAFVNKGGSQILRRCTGATPAAGILRHLHDEIGWKIKPEEFWAFLMSAQRRQFLEFSEQPSAPVPTRETGAIDALWPVHASIELTKRCNLQCIHCYADATSGHRDEMSTAELLRILRDLSARGLAGVELTGGEPMLHPDFWQILDECLDNFSTIAVLTNGTLVTDAVVQKLAPFSGRIMFSISLDGSTAERHDAIRGPRAFERTTRAIRSLTAAGFKVRVCMAVGAYNTDDVKATGKLAAALGGTSFSAAPVVPFGRGQTVSELRPGEWSGLLGALESLPEVSCVVDPTFREVVERMGNCGMGITNLVVTPTGKIKACPFLGEDDFLGDARLDPIDDVLTSDRVRALSVLRAPSPATCQGCRFEPYCRGCISRAMQVQTMTKSLCVWADKAGLTKVFPSYAALPLTQHDNAQAGAGIDAR